MTDSLSVQTTSCMCLDDQTEYHPDVFYMKGDFAWPTGTLLRVARTAV